MGGDSESSSKPQFSLELTWLESGTDASDRDGDPGLAPGGAVARAAAPPASSRASAFDSSELTSVDLGEDLLAGQPPARPVGSEGGQEDDEAPSARNTASPSNKEASPGDGAFGGGSAVGGLREDESDAEKLETAKILESEGFREDAKKILRGLLIRDSANLPARTLLTRIQDEELQLLLSAEPMVPVRARTSSLSPVEASAEETLGRLEKELGLAPEPDPALAPAHPRASLANAEFDRLLAGTSARERLDWGIAFHEMGLLELASRQFEIARGDLEHRGEAACLKANSLLVADKPAEALLVLEETLAEDELSPAQRVESRYLAGRASESLGKRREALVLYRGVERLEPGYRDTRERIVRLERGVRAGVRR
jgi:hypothetical protein